MTITVAQAMAASALDAVDARVLMRHALDVDAAWLIAHATDVLTAGQQAAFSALAARRRGGAPVAYITGTREFYGREFAVTPAVLIPRPETELLVEWALEKITPRADARVLDLGTGSGCIAISIACERPRANVMAVDQSESALEVARGNAQRQAIGNVSFLHSDWFAALGAQRFDCIVANPPYIAEGDAHLAQGDLRFEPAAALSSGRDGLDAIRLIVAQATPYLQAGGWLALEHGYDQAVQCRQLLEEAGYTQVFSQRDLAGIERISGGCLDASRSSI